MGEVMIIEKVYNNNVIQVKDESGQELIVMGRGLGFQKKVGDMIDQTKIEKVFTLQSEQTSSDLSDLYEQLPDKELNLFVYLIDRAEKALQLTFDSHLHLSLTDHLHFMVVRVRQGVSISNPLAWEVRKFYPKEYQVSKDMIARLSEELKLSIPDDEASSIALHFINAQSESGGISSQDILIEEVNRQLDQLEKEDAWAFMVIKRPEIKACH